MDNNQKQLQQEIENIRVMMEQNANKSSLPLLQAYKKALNDLRGQMGIIYSKHSTDGKLDVTNTERYAILAAMESKLKNMGQTLIRQGNTVMTGILKDTYKNSYYRTAYTLDKGIKTGIDFDILRPEFVNKAVTTPIHGELYSKRIWNNTEQLINVIRDNLEQGMIDGISIDKLSDNISDVMGSGAYDSTRLINTEMARCTNSAQQQIYQDSGVVKQVMWSATLENNTCEECGSRDGQYFDIDNAPSIPEDSHPNCRCCLIPVVPDWSPSTRYNQETGESQEYQTYEEWAEGKNTDE